MLKICKLKNNSSMNSTRPSNFSKTNLNSQKGKGITLTPPWPKMFRFREKDRGLSKVNFFVKLKNSERKISIKIFSYSKWKINWSFRKINLESSPYSNARGSLLNGRKK